MFEDLMVNLLANALWALAGGAYGRLTDSIHQRSLVEIAAHDKELSEAIEAAVSQVADLASDAEMGILLQSPAVASLLRQLYALEMSDEQTGAREQLRRVLERTLARHLNKRIPDVRLKANRLFDALELAVKLALRAAIDKGVLAAHELASIERHRRILDELASIESALGLLNPSGTLSFDDISEFESTYRKQVAGRHADMLPPDLDRARRVPLDDLYVPHRFTYEDSDSKHEEHANQLDGPQLLGQLHRAVVLGNPGGGKSTLSQKIVLDLARQQGSHVCGREVTPVLVVLRDYGAEKKARPCSVLEYISRTSESLYQVSPPRRALEYLLSVGRLLVVFDGLDELLDNNYRREITGDVESFASLYPSTPILVTSREVGYEQAPLDDSFQVFRISPFEDDQVTTYAQKWFRLEEDLTPDQRSARAGSFVGESSTVEDLRSNPLMLALMCQIYRGENYIPRNRPDVYEKCAIMLFDRWDRSRGIESQLPFEAHINAAIRHLAYWIFADEALQGGVREEQLVRETAAYLLKHRYETLEEAEHAAHAFVEFCRGRAWVLTDTGTTAAGENLYQFTHRTFLEYFAAAHLVRINHSPASLLRRLRPRIARREWDMVAQLAFQIMDKTVEGASAALLTDLMRQSKQYRQTSRRLGTASFASRCLQFLVPPPAVIRQIVSMALDSALHPVHDTTRSGWLTGRLSSWGPLAELLPAAAENRPLVTGTLREGLTAAVRESRAGSRLIPLDIAANLHIPTFVHEFAYIRGEPSDYWEQVSAELVRDLLDDYRQEAEVSASACCLALAHGVISVDDAVRLHGIAMPFLEYRHAAFDRLARLSWASVMAGQMRSIRDPASHNAEIFGRLASCLDEYDPPWIPKTNQSPAAELNVGSSMFLLQAETRDFPQTSDPAVAYSLWSTLAMGLEVDVKRVSRREVMLDRILAPVRKDKGAPSFMPLLLARYSDDASSAGHEQLAESFGSEARALLALGWSRGEIDLLE